MHAKSLLYVLKILLINNAVSRPLMLSQVNLSPLSNRPLISAVTPMGKLSSAKIFLTGLNKHIFICIQRDVTLATVCIFGHPFI